MLSWLPSVTFLGLAVQEASWGWPGELSIKLSNSQMSPPLASCEEVGAGVSTLSLGKGSSILAALTFWAG